MATVPEHMVETSGGDCHLCPWSDLKSPERPLCSEGFFCRFALRAEIQTVTSFNQSSSVASYNVIVKENMALIP